jgi:hypothetical protein
MIDSADDINKAIATTLINFGYKVNGATDVYPRVEIISVEAEEGLEKDNEDEYVNATIEILGKSKSGKSQVMTMRKKILEKFRYTGFDGLSNVSVTVCTLETDTDLHESDEVDEIYRRILTFRILTHKL